LAATALWSGADGAPPAISFNADKARIHEKEARK
jgi:hypothetical protein